MIQMNIDIGDLPNEFNLSKQEVDGLLEYAVDEVSTQFARTWTIEAKSKLRQSRGEYVDAISIAKRGSFERSVYLNPSAWLPNAIELGYSSFDMKRGMLNSPKIKRTKNGDPYLTIPFRFGTPSALGENNAFTGILPSTIHSKVVKAEKAGTNKNGLQLRDIPTKYQIPKSATLRRRLKSKGASLTSGVKMTSIYQGIKKSGRGGYVMFRRVSLNSQTESWQHPGFVARNIALSSLESMNVPNVVDDSIDNYLNALGF